MIGNNGLPDDLTLTGEPLIAETAARATRARDTNLDMAMVRESGKRVVSLGRTLKRTERSEDKVVVDERPR